MGGSKARDVPANIVTMCAWFNGAMEMDADAAETARRYGWKISTHDDPKIVPCFNVNRGWVILTNKL